MAKIIKLINTTGADITLVGRILKANTNVNIDGTEAYELRDDEDAYDNIVSGAIVVNDGTNDMKPMVGWDYLKPDGVEVRVAQTSDIGENKKIWVHTSSKPEIDGKQFYIQYSGAGDDIAGGLIGGGNMLQVQMEIGEAEKAVDVDFITDKGDVYIHEAYAMWCDAGWGDTFSVEIYAKATPMQTLQDLHYIIVDNVVMASPGGPGTGTHGFAGNPVLLKMNDWSGLWDYDSVNGLRPNLEGKGRFHIMDKQLMVNRFMNRIPVHGSNHNPTRFDSNDTAWMPPGYFLRLTAHNNSNTKWNLSLSMTTFRETTA